MAKIAPATTTTKPVAPVTTPADKAETPKPTIKSVTPAAEKTAKVSRAKSASRETCATVRKEFKDTDVIHATGDITARVGTVRYALMEAIRKAPTVGAAKGLEVVAGERKAKVTKVDIGFAAANGMIKVSEK